MVYPSYVKSSLSRAPKPTVASIDFPPSVGGINALDSLLSMAPSDAIRLKNLIPTPKGIRLREGYVEWAHGVTGDEEIRTLVPFEGQSSDNSNDGLFAVTRQGIYDVTANGETSPTQVIDFHNPEPATYDEQAGRGVYTHFTADNQEHYLFYADGGGGLYRYQESNDTWTTYGPSDITSGITPADCVFIMGHKQRLWMIEKDSSDAYYLGIDSIAGASTLFTFGSKFTHGGHLMGLYSWTLDGGDGVDDYLVAVSRSGDVLVYKGSDPSATDWSLVGSWYIGEVPNSRRLALEEGGSMYILSTYGLVDLSALLQGKEVDQGLVSPARKISGDLSSEVKAELSSPEWQVSEFSGGNFVHIISPWDPSINEKALHYVQNTLTKGWCQFENLPALCSDTWQGRYYFGTRDGKVFLYGGGLDGSLIDIENEGEVIPGAAREFDGLTAFQTIGNSLSFKNGHHVRMFALANGNFRWNAKAVYDFDISDSPEKPGIVGATDVAIWDDDSWNLSVWGGGVEPVDLIVGDMGIGRSVAISFAGNSSAEMIILGWNYVYQGGGLL